MQTRTLTRRDFSYLIGALPSALLAGNAVTKGQMYPALNSVLISDRVKWPDFARLAAKVGFPGTDILLRPAMEQGAEATRQLFSSLHLKPGAINLSVEFRKDDQIFNAGLEKLADEARFASAIGCPRIVTYIMSSSDTPTDELRRLYKKRLSACAKVMEQSQVRFGLEFLGPLQFRKTGKYEFIWKMNDMLEFAKECGPNVGLLLDAWHWHHAGATKADILKAGRDRIVHVHFDDAPKLPPEQIKDNERLLPGEGVIDLTGFLQTLQKIGYTDALSVEVFGRGLKQMTPEVAAQMGHDKAAEVLRKAHVGQATLAA